MTKIKMKIQSWAEKYPEEPEGDRDESYFFLRAGSGISGHKTDPGFELAGCISREHAKRIEQGFNHHEVLLDMVKNFEKLGRIDPVKFMNAYHKIRGEAQALLTKLEKADG